MQPQTYKKIKGDYESSAAVGGFVTEVLKLGLGSGGFMRS